MQKIVEGILEALRKDQDSRGATLIITTSDAFDDAVQGPATSGEQLNMYLPGTMHRSNFNGPALDGVRRPDSGQTRIAARSHPDVRSHPDDRQHNGKSGTQDHTDEVGYNPVLGSRMGVTALQFQVRRHRQDLEARARDPRARAISNEAIRDDLLGPDASIQHCVDNIQSTAADTGISQNVECPQEFAILMARITRCTSAPMHQRLEQLRMKLVAHNRLDRYLLHAMVWSALAGWVFESDFPAPPPVNLVDWRVINLSSVLYVSIGFLL
ncbi:uncharacterized protein BDZ99DRAFT_521269 [Mytilinidion resinicola]|uniref:Uncharacterized protein n=1 Tax=Mytilinidion resinicola TaxID=574789 RepID=A0A6A6YJ03_9PEZI|nr:uncharacterized protein BDZ99DRAFT_521269 [Mytilinidion resinicola]KAF2808781.1 hypothetical protein BDZ99DRAFT_521269 [Mytilinidion resinicola]